MGDFIDDMFDQLLADVKPPSTAHSWLHLLRNAVLEALQPHVVTEEFGQALAPKTYLDYSGVSLTGACLTPSDGPFECLAPSDGSLAATVSAQLGQVPEERAFIGADVEKNALDGPVLVSVRIEIHPVD